MGINLWKAEQLGKENFALGAASRDAEIKSLRQQLVSRNVEIANLNERLVTLSGITSTHIGEKEKLRQQLATAQTESEEYAKNLRGKHDIAGATYATLIAERYNLRQQLVAALAATADLKDVHLCHAEPAGEVVSYDTAHMYDAFDSKTLLYRAWEPK